MKSTSSRSVKVIPKTEDVPDTSGTPPTEETSETTSAGYTEWTVMTGAGKRMKVTLPGDRGRISYGRAASRGFAEVRFYANPTTKIFDVVLPDVEMIWSDRALVEDLGKAPSIIEAEEVRDKFEKSMEERRIRRVTDAILLREYPDLGMDDIMEKLS